jgi:hypothetical protein
MALFAGNIQSFLFSGGITPVPLQQLIILVRKLQWKNPGYAKTDEVTLNTPTPQNCRAQCIDGLEV